MKSKVRQYLGVFFLFLFAGSFITAKPCMAASATVELSSDVSEVTVGDNIAVYITIDSNTVFGDFEANLTYNEDILEYQGGASVISGSNGFLKISDMGVTQGSRNRKYSMKFEASQAGICEINFQGRAMVYDLDSGYEMSVSSNLLTINVKAKETASSNAALKSLKTVPSDFTPAFDKDVHEYDMMVGYKTEQLIINALPEDSEATVSISGNDSLKEGKNKVVITVLAESGDDIEYTINVNREPAPEDETVSEDTEITSGEEQSSVEIVRMDDLKYIVYSGKYQLIEPDSEVTIPSGYVKTKLIISDIAITAFSPEDNMESDFLLIYAMNELGEEGFYRYDRIEKSLQRYIPYEQYAAEDTTSPDNDDIIQSEEYRASLNKAAVAIALLSSLSALLLVIIIRLILKVKGYKEDDLD